MVVLQKYQEEMINEIKDLSEEQIEYLMKIIKLVKKSINRQKEYDFEIKSELKEWDSLSDEALIDFESNL
jgi:DNA-directed RNA polymerase alpha subunit